MPKRKTLHSDSQEVTGCNCQRCSSKCPCIPTGGCTAQCHVKRQCQQQLAQTDFPGCNCQRCHSNCPCISKGGCTAQCHVNRICQRQNMDPNDHVVKPLARLLRQTLPNDVSSLILQYHAAFPVKVIGGEHVFAIVMSNGQVQMIGGAKIDDVKTHLEAPARAGVKNVYATAKAFAAHMGDSSVVTWGYKQYGGIVNDSDEHVINKVVTTIASTTRAFAAILQDGSLMAWGNAKYGGQYTPVEVEVKSAADKEYDMIVSNHAAFAAKTKSGSVVAWGCGDDGGKIDQAAGELLVSKKKLGCLELVATNWGFCAVMGDYSLVVWGRQAPSHEVRRALAQPESAMKVWASKTAFLVQSRIGNATFLGYPEMTDDTRNALNKSLSHRIYSVTTTDCGFAALLSDQTTVVKWDDYGRQETRQFLGRVEEIFATANTIAVLTRDKQLFLWGEATSKRGSQQSPSQQRVRRIHVTKDAIFAEMLGDKKLLVWGEPVMARSIPVRVQATIQLRGLNKVVSCTGGCAALLLDGSVIGWFFNSTKYLEFFEFDFDKSLSPSWTSF